MESQAHGVLLEVRGVGVLLLGPSGIGKSECALELINRGHRLVADDVVQIRVGPDGRPEGTAPELIRYHIEIRGIGILYVPDLFGPDAVKPATSIDLVCRIEHWRKEAEYERVGLDRPTEPVAGAEVPSLLLPARPAGSMATLVEVAVRDHEQRRWGESAARRLDARLQGGKTGP